MRKQFLIGIAVGAAIVIMAVALMAGSNVSEPEKAGVDIVRLVDRGTVGGQEYRIIDIQNRVETGYRWERIVLFGAAYSSNAGKTAVVLPR